MIRYKLFLCLIILNSLSANSFAQDKFGSGYYINHENDTIKGFIKYKNNLKHSFTFRSTLKSKSQLLDTVDAKFVAFISGNSYQLINFAEKDLPPMRIFSKVLVTGTVDLYSNYGKFLIGSDQKGRFLLTGGKPSNSSESQSKYQKSIGAFNVLFFDCPAVQAEAQGTAVDEERLVNLVKKYHDCKSLQYDEYTPQRGKRLRVGLSVGMNFASLSFHGTREYLNETSFQTYAHPSGSAILLFSPSRKPSSIFNLQVELLYASMKFAATSILFDKTLTGNDIKTTTTTTVDYAAVIPRLGFRFNIRSNTINPYFGLGISGRGIGSFKSHMTQTVQINLSTDTRESTSIELVKLPFWVSAGLKKELPKHGALFLDVSYEGTPLSSDGEIKSINTRLGYIF